MKIILLYWSIKSHYFDHLYLYFGNKRNNQYEYIDQYENNRFMKMLKVY